MTPGEQEIEVATADSESGTILIDDGVWSGIKVVDCFSFQDEELCAEAVSAMAYLLSKPKGWKVRVGDVCRRFGWGRDMWRKVRRNLEQRGYLEGRAIAGRGYAWKLRSRPAEASGR